MSDAPPLIVGGAALVSALGLDWRAACAAARAGLRRAAPLPDFEAQSEIDGEEEPVIAHAAALATHGFEGGARRLRLVAAALRELLAQRPDLDPCDDLTGYVLVLGPVRRHLRGADLVADAATADELRAEARHAASAGGRDVDAPPPSPIDVDRALLLARAAALAGLRGSPRLLRCVEQDDVSAVVALHWATGWLGDAASGLRRIVVVSADTLLDPATVSWLGNTGRLKASAMPVGLEPGEACVALLLETQDARDAGSARPLGVLHGTAFAQEPSPLLSGRPSTGAGTARLFDEFATREGWGAEPRAWIVSDHNGEPYRANDLALALVRARPRCPALDAPSVGVPATSFGDVGAARGLLGVCVALAAFDRGYAPAERALVLAVCETDRRAGVLVGRAAS